MRQRVGTAVTCLVYHKCANSLEQGSAASIDGVADTLASRVAAMDIERTDSEENALLEVAKRMSEMESRKPQ